MLILTRKTNEIIRIADDVEVKVLSVKGSQVRIGITAPKNIPVHRSEIYQRIKAESNDDNVVVDHPARKTAESY